MDFQRHFPGTSWLLRHRHGKRAMRCLGTIGGIVVLLVLALNAWQFAARVKVRRALQTIQVLEESHASDPEVQAALSRLSKTTHRECKETSCVYEVSFYHFALIGDRFMERSFRSALRPSVIDLLSGIGIHPLLFHATVVTHAGRMYESSAEIMLGYAPTLAAGYGVQHSFSLHYDGITELDEHPNYMVRRPHLTTPGGGEIIDVSITPESTEQEIQYAHDLDLSCITRWGGCETVANLMPSAARYQAPFEWDNQKFRGCSLQRLARDLDRVLVVEVKSVERYRGDWSEPRTQTVRYKLVRVLKADDLAPININEMSHAVQRDSLTASPFEPGLSRELFSPGRKLVLLISKFDRMPDPDCGVLPANSDIVTQMEENIRGLAK